jgi:predicted anti-sigma-YlaC factor YlaD
MADNPKLIDKGCPVRPCVIEKGLDNCAQCEQYVCEKVAERLVLYEQVRERVGVEIPEDDYICFIRAYENERRLDALRSSSI